MSKIKLQSISASERWLQCTKSLEYNQTFTSNRNATYGKMVHEAVSLRLKEIFGKEDNKERIKQIKTEDYVDENDATIIVSWDKHAEKIYTEYIDYVLMLVNKYKPKQVFLEQKVDVVWYGYSKYGFIDLIMFHEKGVFICDLKTGWTKVDVKDNSQMLIYLLGVIQTYPKLANKDSEFTISICQPVIGNINSQDLDLDYLVGFYNSKNDKMNEIITGNLQYDPSSKACKYCDYKEFCNERISKGVF